MKTFIIVLFRILLTRRQRALPALLLLALSPAASRAQLPVIPVDVRTNIMSLVTNGFTPAIVVGLVNSNGTTFFSCGVRDLDTGEPVNEDSVFEIGALTQTFTGTILSQMALDGSLALTNLVQSYLPDSVRVPSRGGQGITLEHLVTHRSSLPNEPTNLSPHNLLNRYAGYTVEQMYDFLSDFQLPHYPGGAYEYSDFGVGLLGWVLQRKTGLDYETLIAERITQTLGMTNTGVHLSPEWVNRLVRKYSGVVMQPNSDFTPALAGAAALRASARDLLHYVAANMGLVQTDLYPAMTNAQAALRPMDNGGSAGMGWFSITLPSDRAIYRFGGTYGHCAFAGFLESKRLGAVVLTSCAYTPTMGALTEHLLDPTVPLDSVPPSVAVDLDSLRHCVGRYQISGGDDYIDIGLQHGYLTIAASTDHGYAFTLYPSSPSVYFAVDVVGTATFQTNSAGLATDLTWVQNGHPTAYTRVALPARLAIQRVNGQNQLTFSGDTGVNYVLEASTNFSSWQPISTNNIWTQPVTAPESTVSRFYRLRLP